MSLPARLPGGGLTHQLEAGCRQGLSDATAWLCGVAITFRYVVHVPDVFVQVHRQLIIRLAEQYRLPGIYPYRFFPTSGGLLSYGIDTVAIFRQAASYVDRILKGEKPADLPVQAPVSFKLIVNLKAARAIGLTIPESFLLRADEVIE